MATKAIYKRYDGASWVEFYFQTSADLVAETTSYKVMTAAERTAIATYLTGGFNAANKLLQLDGSALVPAAQIPTNLTAYLKTTNPSFSGTMAGGDIDINGTLQALNGEFSVSSISNGFILGAAGGAQVSMDTNARFNSTVQVSTPTADTHATTKLYVDNLVASGLKFATNGPVKAATTGNITLSGEQIIDGYFVSAGERVLVKNQTNTAENGIYTASASTWTKDTVDSKAGKLVFVENGSTQNDWTFQATSDTSWSAASKVDSYTAGSGITKTGTQFSIAGGAITNSMLAGSIDWAKLASSGTYVFDNASTSYDTWAELGAAQTSATLAVKVSNALAAIGLLRGTANYNTSNTQTIAGVYTIANAKNATFTGTDATPTGTFTAGDLYFQQLA